MKRECRIQAVEQKAQNMMQGRVLRVCGGHPSTRTSASAARACSNTARSCTTVGSGPDNTTARGPPAQSSSGSRQPHEVALSHLLAISVVQPNSRDIRLQVLDPSSRVSADRASSRLLDRISSMRGVLQSRDDQAGTATFGLFAHGSMTRIPQCTGVPVRECLGRNPGLRGLHMDFRDRGRSADYADLHMDVGNDGSSWNMIVFQELADGWQKQCGARRRGRVFLGVRLSPLKSLCLQSPAQAEKMVAQERAWLRGAGLAVALMTMLASPEARWLWII